MVWEIFTKHRFPHFLCFFHLVNNEGLPGPGNLTTISVQGTNPLLTMKTGYSGITTPITKKLVSTKAL
jgi:hypothetical protein